MKLSALQKTKTAGRQQMFTFMSASMIFDDLPAPLEEPTCPDALIGSLPSLLFAIHQMCIFPLDDIDQIHSRKSYFWLVKRTNNGFDVLKAKE